VGQTITKLSAAEVKGRMDRGERFAFVDARSSQELNESNRRLPGAVRMTAAEVDRNISVVPQGRTIITYCTGSEDQSSVQVALNLMRRGFLNVYPLIGGLDAWREVGGAIESTEKEKNDGNNNDDGNSVSDRR
jgi:rhodanese-related sulfurtransferase